MSLYLEASFHKKAALELQSNAPKIWLNLWIIKGYTAVFDEALTTLLSLGNALAKAQKATKYIAVKPI